MGDLHIGKNLFLCLLVKTKENLSIKTKKIGDNKKKNLNHLIGQFCDLIDIQPHDTLYGSLDLRNSDRSVQLIEEGTLGDLFGKFDKAFVLKISSNFKSSMGLVTDFLYYFPKIFTINLKSKNKMNDYIVCYCNDCKIYFSITKTYNICPFCGKDGRIQDRDTLSTDIFEESFKKYMEKYNYYLSKIDKNLQYFTECINYNLDLHPRLTRHLLAELILINNKYLFSWDEVPGNDTEILREFITQKYGINWIKTAKAEKINCGETIKMTNEKNFLLLRLNNEKTKIDLETDDGRIDEFIAKKENCKLNIYYNDNEIDISRVVESFESAETLVEHLMMLKKSFYALRGAYFEIKLQKLFNIVIEESSELIEYAFPVVGFKIYENNNRPKKRYSAILFTRFDHSFSPSEINEVWNRKLKDYLDNNVQYIFHGFNTNEMICVLCDDSFKSLKIKLIDEILEKFNEKDKLIIESTTIFCPYKNYINEIDDDEPVCYLIFVKRNKGYPKPDLLNLINNKINEAKENYCRNNCGNAPLDFCANRNNIEIGTISSCQGYFDLIVPVTADNPCIVSTLVHHLRKIPEVEDTSTIVQIQLSPEVSEVLKNERLD